MFNNIATLGIQYFTTLNGNTVTSNVVTEAAGAAISSSEAACAGGVTAGVVDASGPLGYLAEGARTNRALYSQTWENAAWAATNVTKADNSAVAPDGTSTAATLTATAGNGTVIQDLGVVASASKTGGVWIKRKTGVGDIEVTMDGGSTWTAVTVTAAWTRVSKNQTLADEDFGIRIVTNADAVYVWNGQVETAAFLSSDIPTTTVAVQRNADSDTYVTSGNFSDAQGTMYAEVSYAAWANAVGSIIGSTTQGMLPLATNSGVKGYDGTNTVSGTAGTPSGVVKMAVAWFGTTMTVCAGGTAAVSGTYDGTWNLTTLGVGLGSFATCRNVRLYPTALSAAKLVSMTT